MLVHCTKLWANRACAPRFGSAPSYKLSERVPKWENVSAYTSAFQCTKTKNTWDTFYGPDGAYVYIEGY